jgi:hypothetical protein
MHNVEKKKLSFAIAPFDDRGLPDVHPSLYDNVIVFDHVEKVLLFLSYAIQMSLITCFTFKKFLLQYMT